VLAAIDLKSRTSESAAKALAEAALRDSFWGVRIEAVKGLSGFKTDSSRTSLIDAANDKDSRIRREAIKGLAVLKDPRLADMFIKAMNSDPSYFAVAEAARALGQTGSPKAYDVLTTALNLESWQGTIRTGVLGGLAELKDARTLESALKYSTPGNPSNVRSAAFQLLAEIGKGNDRAFEALISVLKDKSLQSRFNAIEALAKLGDQRAIPALEELARSSDIPAFGKSIIAGAIEKIRNSPRKTDQE
jgi:aminopeptidase N